MEIRALLLCDSHHGIYTPELTVKHLINLANEHQAQIVYDEGYDPSEDIDIICKGPDEEEYWEAWEDYTNKTTIYMDNEPYSIVHNEDLWLVHQEDYQNEELMEEWTI